MMNYSRARIAQIYGATVEEVDAAERKARLRPLTRLGTVTSPWRPLMGHELERLVNALQEPGACEALVAYVQATLTPEISAELRGMPYEDFLGTRYWWVVKGV